MLESVTVQANPSLLFLTVDLLGVAAFALSGALLGVRRNLDLFGVAVLAAVTGLGGGMTRDLLLGATPPATLLDWRYLATTLVAGGIAFLLHGLVGRMERPVAVWDAAGMALFCVTGTTKAMQFGLPPHAAALLGMLTAIGGGVIRDLLTARVPTVLQKELYATPSLVGASIVATVWWAGGSVEWASGIAIAVAFGWRYAAIRRGWNAPYPSVARGGSN